MVSADTYSRQNLLMEPAAISTPEMAKQFVIVDARKRADFDAGRIPGAAWVDVAAWAKAFGDGKNVKDWGARIGSLGIRPDSKVVVCGASPMADAARVWWILRYWGVRDVRLLNGGWTGWQKARLPVETNKPKPVAAVEFAATPAPERLATKLQILKSLEPKDLQIVDARSQNEFCGIDKLKNKRGGAIPGAKNLDWTDLIDKETQRFKSADELRKLFEKAGIDLSQPTAAHCQSGGRSSVMAFALELMGADHVRNYFASWAEWGNADDTPIVVREQPKPKDPAQAGKR
jgi:thiosulfate/3-mercaptopyruvate sulfurtransferase